MIQTYNPGHYCIDCAARADYEGFYEEEYGFRRLMNYPPARCMLSVMILSADEGILSAASDRVAEDIRIFIDGKSVKKNTLRSTDFKVIGPVDAPLAKARDIYRKVVNIKAGDYSTLVELKNELSRCEEKYGKDIGLQFNFN